jgi:hypothetical protein
VSIVGPPRLPPRLIAALAAVDARLARAGVGWLLAGGAARALAGAAARRPADLDLEVDTEAMPAASAALGLSARRVEDPDGTASLRARGRVAGAEVDLTAGLEARGPGGRLPADFALQRAWATPATVAGRTVWLAPPEEALARALVRGDAAALARAATSGGGPGLRLDYVLRRLAASSAAR